MARRDVRGLSCVWQTGEVIRSVRVLIVRRCIAHIALSPAGPRARRPEPRREPTPLRNGISFST